MHGLNTVFIFVALVMLFCASALPLWVYNHFWPPPFLGGVSNALGISDYARFFMELGFFPYCYCCLIYRILSLIQFQFLLWLRWACYFIYIFNYLSQLLSNFPDNNGSKGIFASPAVLLIVLVLFIFASFSSFFSKKCLHENDQQLKLQRPPPFHPFAPTWEPGGQDCVLRRRPLFMRALQLSRLTWLLQTLYVHHQAQCPWMSTQSPLPFLP